ncbi:hypothetical protein M2146_000264 [Lachnospiraceae bacterium PF1-22]|uniref:hypothetical protein n=1 Tax=Ohessyouella blattaphilus TaxID=2949333 RepID=UPI003E1AC136
MENIYLICWKESRTKKWEAVKKEDENAFLMNLMRNPKIDWHTIFIIPTNGFVCGIWLSSKTHKSSRVNWFDFFDDFGMKYKKPEVSEEVKRLIQEENEKRKGKYGWISPDGRYFHCEYQGHSSLAYDICYGMTDTDNSERYLEEHGWCKIYKNLGKQKYSVYVGGSHVITKAQMATLARMELDNAEGISDMLCK